MKKIIVALVIFTIVQTACAELVEYDRNKDTMNHSIISDIRPNQNTSTYKILFIGSSYFNFNDLPELFKQLTLCAEKDIYIDHIGKNGMYLDDHASSNSTEEKIKEMEWDYIILQGVGAAMAYPSDFTVHEEYPALKTLWEKIHRYSDSAKMVYCMPWAYEDGMTWYQNWTDTYADMQEKIYDTTLNYSNDIGFMIAPVGSVWYTVLEEQGYPLHYLHMSDWNHPSLKGSYLMACVIYSTVFIEPSINISYYASLDEDEAHYFQTIASNTVLNNLSLWNIENTSTNNPPYKPEKPSGPTSIRKNVPYNFTSSTADADGDMVYYLFEWGDGNSSNWIGPYGSGEIVKADHRYVEKGPYSIRVKAKDVHGAQSDWSEPLDISKQKVCLPYSSLRIILEMAMSCS